MKNSLSIFLILVTLTTLFSCTKIKNVCNDVVIKEYNNDTVLPSDYFARYPGSWWTYTDGDSIKIQSWNNLKTHKSIPNGNCRTIYENNHILPGQTFGNYMVITYPDLSDSEFIPYISETPGVIYTKVTKITEGTSTYTIKVFPKMDSLVVNQVVYYDVVKVRHLSEYYYYKVGNAGNGGRDYYYSKNIGLIRIDYIMNGASVHVNELVNYYIAPH